MFGNDSKVELAVLQERFKAHEQIIDKVDSMGNFKLMKRDYMGLIKYYYESDFARAQKYFESKIINANSDINTSIIQDKDISFILSNKLTKLLGYLSGLYVCVDINESYPIVSPDENLIKFTIGTQIQARILELIESSMGKFAPIVKKFYNKKNIPHFAIIDAGNVLHARKGQITETSISDLENIIVKTRYTIGEPLVIIHKRHEKSFPKLLEVFTKNYVNYFQTPHNFNDDIFIMWFFVKSGCSACIISNDKYRDHIFNYQTSDKTTKTSDNSLMCNFSNLIQEQTLTYQLEPIKIKEKLPYSNCIQIIENFAYVPHISGSFIKVVIE